MELILTLLWFASGLLGAFLMFVNWQWFIREPVCPAPINILRWILASPLGPVLLGAAVIVLIIDFFERRPRRDSWWTRPICKR